MHKIIFYNIGQPPHPLFRGLIDNPPEGYAFIEENTSEVLNKEFVGRKIISKTVGKLVNLHKLHEIKSKFSRKDADFVLSAGHLYGGSLPWILHISETITSLTGYDSELFKRQHKKLLKKLQSEKCRAIVISEDHIKKEIERWFGKTLQNKIYKIMPYASFFSQKNTQKSKKSLLFVGSANNKNPDAFTWKGGFLALKIFAELKIIDNTYQLTIISKVPEEAKKLIQNVPGITYKDNLPKSKLFKEYSKHSYLFCPAYGAPIMSSLESLHHSLPIITLNARYNKEYFSDKKNAILFTPPPIQFYEEQLPPFGESSKRYAEFLKEFAHPSEEYCQKSAREIHIKIQKTNLSNLKEESLSLVNTGNLSEMQNSPQWKCVFDKVTNDKS